MQIERVVRTFAGSLTLLGLGLGYFVAPGWYWLTAFVGANLFQSGITGFCPLALMLARLHKAPLAGR
jgi:hypothetical protein